MDYPVRSILNFLALHPIKTMNVAFFRYFPILNREDCNDDGLDKLLRDTATHFADCDYGELPVRKQSKLDLVKFYPPTIFLPNLV